MAGLTHALSSPYLLNIAVYMLLYTVLSTFLYFQQAAIVDASFADRGARRAFFAQVDLLINAITIGAQLFLTGRVLKRLGVAATLTVVPAITAIGFLWLGLAPTVAVVVGFLVLRRAGNFAFARPTREVLFTVVSREDKYKAKNFIDTVVYRLGRSGRRVGVEPGDHGWAGHRSDRLGRRAAGAGLGGQRVVAGTTAGGDRGRRADDGPCRCERSRGLIGSVKETAAMTLTRREWLALTMGAGAAMAFDPQRLWAQGAIGTRAIPSSGERIPVIGLGSSATFAQVARSEDLTALREVFKAMVERGATVFDTAPGYGASEEAAGRIATELKLTDRIFWATKLNVAGRGGGGADPAAARAQVETSFKRIGKAEDRRDPGAQHGRRRRADPDPA